MPNKTYRVIPTDPFLRDLKKIDPKVAKKTLDKIDELEANPYIGKKLTNLPFGRWRVKVSKDYRIRYDIEGDEVVLKMIRHRKDVYKKR